MAAVAGVNEDSEVLDWLRRPAKGRKLGGWGAQVFLLGATSCGYFAFGGIFFNLVLYLIRVWHEDNATAANEVTNVLGTMFFTSLVGAFLGDAYLGRLWTVALFLVLYAVGCVLLGIAVTLQEHADQTRPLSPAFKFLVFFALYVTALGCGSYAPVLASLGGDQLEAPSEKAIFFNWVFISASVGQLVPLTFLTYIEDNGQWALGFWIAGGAVLIGLFMFLLGAPKYRQYQKGGNPLVRVLQVFVCAFRKFSLTAPSDAKSLHEVEAGQPSVIKGCRKLGHTDQFRWLDRAATMTSSEDVALFKESTGVNPWRLCTVTQVEEVKCLIRISPFLIAGTLFYTVLAQLTFFVEQAAMMDGHLGPRIRYSIPPGSNPAFMVVGVIVFGPLYDYVIVPWLRKWTGQAKGLTTLQRMGWGLLTSILAMVVAAMVERKRLRRAKEGAGNNILSVYWLVPQNAILAVATMLLITGQVDFFYTEVSDGMRSMGVSLALASRGVGNYVSTMLVTMVTQITTRGGKDGWIPNNLDDGHLDYFYWLLAIIMGGTLVFYGLAARSYTYLSITREPPQHPLLEISHIEDSLIDELRTEDSVIRQPLTS